MRTPANFLARTNEALEGGVLMPVEKAGRRLGDLMHKVGDRIEG